MFAVTKTVSDTELASGQGSGDRWWHKPWPIGQNYPTYGRLNAPDAKRPVRVAADGEP